MVRRLSQVLKRKEKMEADQPEPFIWLDQDTAQRLRRLKGHFKGFNDTELMALALKSLESQINRLVKRRVRKRIHALKKHELSSQQIAGHLNNQGVHVPGHADIWDPRTIDKFAD